MQGEREGFFHGIPVRWSDTKAEEFELIALKSGHTSLRLVANQETFHPGIGPEAEARILHVEQQGLWEKAQTQGRLIIWDVGLGAAANAVAALERLGSLPAHIELHSFEKTLAPLNFALQNTQALSYLLPYQDAVHQLLTDGVSQVGSVRWFLHLGDFREAMQRDVPSPDSIFYDPYSSRSNPEMWTLEHFQKLRQRLPEDRPCLLTNYTKSTAIRSTWLVAGFYVGVGVGIGDKDQSTMASNRLDALAKPLTTSWLQKVPASQNANLLRESGVAYGPITDADFALLRQQPQFGEHR